MEPSGEGRCMARLLGMLIGATTLGLVLSGAQAGGDKKGKLDVEAIFKKLDSNTDGVLSKDEFLKMADRFKDKEKARTKLTMTYEKIDPENKGLSRDQFRKYVESVKKKNDKS